MSYDQWKTASPYDDDTPEQTINDLLCDGTILIGYGKPGHGMNGKDADLDTCGQFTVKSLETVDPIKTDSMKILIHCYLYASICPAYYDGDDAEMEEYLLDQSTAIVCGMHPDTFSNDCMFDGDYWSGGLDVTLEVPLSINEYEIIECACDPEHDSAEYDATLKTIADRIMTEIVDSEKGGTPERDKVQIFYEEVALANTLIDGLTD